MFLRVLFLALACFLGALRAQDPGAAPGPERSAAALESHAIEPAAALGADRHLIDLLDRYVWIVPNAITHRISLGAAVLLMLALVLQLSAKMADLEVRTFGRCVAMAAVLFLFTTLQVGLLPSRPIVLVGAALGNFGVWLVAARLFFAAKAWAGFAMFVCFAFALLIAVVLLEVAGFLLGGQLLH